ncbi:MAG: Eco57I restriction-modification methylase domain-containing protein [Burkholderiales bacterium]
MQGQLFTQDFLLHGIRHTPPYQNLDDKVFAHFEQALAQLTQNLRADSVLNEAQTEQALIHPLLNLLGWGSDYLPQVNMSAKGREDVPDLLLFRSPEALQKAREENRDDQRYRHGLTILEAKRWLRPLDRGDASEATDPGAPSSQMLRYLSRAEVVSDRAVKWGMLTNGGVWRLYYQDARSRAEHFFEIDLAFVLALSGIQTDLTDAQSEAEPQHQLKLFYLLFCRDAFLPQPWDSAERSFHAYALNEARLYEEKVSQDLGVRVFTEIFPRLAQALAEGDLQAQKEKRGVGQFARFHYTRPYLDEVRESALVFLYRLLFLFYAEDRHLLPVRDERYRAYSLRRLREQVRDDVDQRKVFSSRVDHIWRALQGVFLLIDRGDDAVGMPAYNGGLFDRARAPLLERTRVPDAVMAPIIDALSRRTEDLLHAWINYRDLSVSHLGGIYERLLEYTLVHEVQAEDDYHDKPEVNRISAEPASFARKVSGSYYTHDDLVRLVLRESVGLLAQERKDAFSQQLSKYKKKPSLNPSDWDVLDKLDPASNILELKVCDPAMGSGHFLVALVDYLADRVLEAINTAEVAVAEQPWSAHLVEQGRPWQSPVVGRIALIRQTIRKTAQQHGWAVTDAQLDDRHIVRRMILKKTIFGVDKNPMAVELAKTALWLHTFTVGAPLSFLDHHLKVGDSLHGERLPVVRRALDGLGMLFQQGELERLALAARNLEQVADFTDVDMAQAQLSKKLAEDAAAQLAPLHALLDFWRALRWLVPGWPVDSGKKLAKLGDDALRLALAELFSPARNLVATLETGRVEGQGAAVEAANALLSRTRELAQREDFFHWWTAFPTVFKGGDGQGGFDAVIGNPPWDRIKLQEVEWFAEREPKVALQARAADRKKLILELQKKNAPVALQYAQATERAEANARVLSKAGDYPLLGGGDVNLYSLFVERAQGLISPNGLVALLTPSGIAADKGAAEFFRSISTTGRLGALFDFENRNNPDGSFFPDVDSRFKFSVMLFGGAQRQFERCRCAFYLNDIEQTSDAERVLNLTARDFALVNPNTGAAPIFRSRRDADITTRIYRSNPVLVRHAEVQTGKSSEHKLWSVKYLRMFDMTNDSHLFLTRAELEKQGFVAAGLNRWRRGDEEAVPLYEGKMVQLFDHRAADVVIHAENLHRAAQPEPIQSAMKEQADRYPVAQFYVPSQETRANRFPWALGFKEISAPTNARTMIASIVPGVGFGNKLPLLVPQVEDAREAARMVALLCATLNSLAFDFVLRQKLQGQTINLFILEQLPAIAPDRFDQPLPTAFTMRMRQAGLMNGHHANPSVADFVIPQVLALSYTAHDLAPFAKDLGYVNEDGSVKPPVVWNEEERCARMNALDALFMHLYGLNADDAAYVMDTFPIVRQQDVAAFGHYRTQAEVLRLLALMVD